MGIVGDLPQDIAAAEFPSEWLQKASLGSFWSSAGDKLGPSGLIEGSGHLFRTSLRAPCRLAATLETVKRAAFNTRCEPPDLQWLFGIIGALQPSLLAHPQCTECGWETSLRVP